MNPLSYNDRWWKSPLWLNAESHVPSFNQSECYISAQHNNGTLKFVYLWHWLVHQNDFPSISFSLSLSHFKFWKVFFFRKLQTRNWIFERVTTCYNLLESNLESILQKYFCCNWTDVQLLQDFDSLCEMLSEFSCGHICTCY